MSDDTTGTTVPLNPPDVCDLFDGGDITEFDRNGEGPPDGSTVKFVDPCWIPEPVETQPETPVVVAQPSGIQTLPATGSGEAVMIAVACCLVAAGTALRRLAA